MNAQQLIDFENEVARRFEAGELRSPTHLSGGNEDQLIEIFNQIGKDDWKFSTHRNHYHALLSGIPKEKVMSTIMESSMNLMLPEYRFFTSAIVGGILPIAVGVADGLKRNGSDRHVWCFVGDMCCAMGLFHEARKYAEGHSLPITFVIEDNGFSTDTPTDECWGYIDDNQHNETNTQPLRIDAKTIYYKYQRTWPHVCTGKYVRF